MKKTIAALFVAFVASVAVAGWREYEQGYNDGFKAGYCSGKGFSSDCAAPYPPAPPASYDETYAGGYSTGFRTGMSYASRY